MQISIKASVLLRLIFGGFFFLVLFGPSGCAVRVIATHQPMHPTNVQRVTFKAVATGEVDKVVLSYKRCTLGEDALGNRTQTCPGSWTTIETCDPPGSVSSYTCSHTMNTSFPANSLIQFKATAYCPQGNAASETYSFAAGDYPWPDDPIPIRVKGDTANKLDVVFIPDTDITVTNFRDQLDEVVENLYFKYGIIKSWRGYYNFYYSSIQGNYEELCQFVNPTNMANLNVVADAVAILHTTGLRDCRSGNLISSEINYDKTLLHETGHVLFNLQDEYCCDSSYHPQDCVPNLWNSLAACQADAPNITHPATNCAQLSKGTQTLPYWYIDPAGADGCMMGDGQHNANSDFGKACQRRIQWRYAKCGQGQCFTTPECP